MTTAEDRRAPSRSAISPSLRFPELQGQRGLAALTIVVFHAYQYDRSGSPARFPYEASWVHPYLFGLDGMVDWFFVLSAFLLTLPYATSLRDGRPVQPAGAFLFRRAVRIVPLYLVAVLVVWASRNSSLPGEWRDLVEHLTFTQVYDAKRIFYTIGPAWSLAVEVQFYIVVAAHGVLLGRLARGRPTPAARLRPLVVSIAVLVLLSAAWSAYFHLVADKPHDDYPYWFGLPAKLVVFGIGMAAAVLVAVRPRELSRNATWLLRGAGIAGFLLACRLRGSSGGADAVFHVACALSFAAVVYAGAVGPARGAWHRASAVGALPWLGMVSYSLYLWHEPLLLELAGHGLIPDPSAGAFVPTVLVLGVLSVLAAWASYWVIEYPASHLRFFLGDVPSRELQAERRAAP
jgi:peptidoglycan/LPS O-acetylase OafA/YrhL